MREKIEMRVLKGLCAETSDSPEQARVNQEEWSNPTNWIGRFHPVYSSRKDSRPIVPRPSGPPPKYVINRGHPRGRFWLYLLRGTMLMLAAVFIGIFIWLAIKEGA
jgi:hypothetical protein